jgi:hypothetical protein
MYDANLLLYLQKQRYEIPIAFAISLSVHPFFASLYAASFAARVATNFGRPRFVFLRV